LRQNYSTKFGEVDLVFVDNGALVFVEVKTRKGMEKGRPEEAVTLSKVRQIRRVADYFMQTETKFPGTGRVDVVAVNYATSLPQIEHFEDVGW